MRKVKLQMQMSVDGFVGRPNGDLDWIIWQWDDPLKNYVTDLMNSIDLIIIGRKLAEGFIPYWEEAAANSSHPEYTGAQKLAGTPKLVFSNTLEKSPWKNAKIAKHNVVDEIVELRTQAGKDIIVYGGADFVSNLVKENLIDEYHLFINPSAIGEGLSIFNSVNQRKNLNLEKVTAFNCGIVVIMYKPISA